MKFPLPIVTGAPGAGKTATVAALLAQDGDCAAFDIDWLIAPASALAGRDIHTDPATWPPYNALWFEVLHAAHRQGRTPLWFAPIDPGDMEQAGRPAWCDRVEWLLLDCADEVRRQRLRQREGWDGGRIEEAVEDAAALRAVVERRVDTGAMGVDDVAQAVSAWCATIH